MRNSYSSPIRATIFAAMRRSSSGRIRATSAGRSSVVGSTRSRARLSMVRGTYFISCMRNRISATPPCEGRHAGNNLFNPGKLPPRVADRAHVLMRGDKDPNLPLTSDSSLEVLRALSGPRSRPRRSAGAPAAPSACFDVPSDTITDAFIFAACSTGGTKASQCSERSSASQRCQLE